MTTDFIKEILVQFEAYQSAWLKCYFPAEFMAAVLTNGKGFYHPLVYALESHRLGLKLLPPSVNEPGPAFVPHGRAIRVPLTRMTGLTSHTMDAILDARKRAPFTSIADFFQRVAPSSEELEAMIRSGAFDEFKDTRTRQFWQAQHLLKTFGSSTKSNQGWLISPPGLEQLPGIPLNEPPVGPPSLTAADVPLRKPCARHALKFDGPHAAKAFQPYDSTKEINGDARQAGASLIEEGKQNPQRKTFIYVNSRLEGNALATVAAMLETSNGV
jgi:hypothetical protein